MEDTEQTKTAEISLRSLQPNDINFLYSTFLRGAYYGNDFYKKIDKQAFFEHYERVLAHMLAKPSLNVVIACLADEPDIILGWVAYEGKTLHWAYTKDAWRRRGIANKMLISCNISTVTHLTKIGEDIRLRKGWGFNPFLI